LFGVRFRVRVRIRIRVRARARARVRARNFMNGTKEPSSVVWMSPPTPMFERIKES
jgi:hypothetical protein